MRKQTGSTEAAQAEKAEALRAHVNMLLTAAVDTAAAAAEGIRPGDPLLDYTAPDRDAYINDPSLLPLHWLGEWTPPAKMLDYGTKVACLVAPDGHSLM